MIQLPWRRIAAVLLPLALAAAARPAAAQVNDSLRLRERAQRPLVPDTTPSDSARAARRRARQAAQDTAGLKPTADGFRVRLSRNQLKVTDGPFTESKEVVGGYALVEVASREEAEKIAVQFMELHRVHWPSFEGESEVRPLEDM